MSFAPRGGGAGRARGGSITRGKLRTGSGSASEGEGTARSTPKQVRFNLDSAPRGSRPSRGTRGAPNIRSTKTRAGQIKAPTVSHTQVQDSTIGASSGAFSVSGANHNDRYTVLKAARERERADAIKNGFLADPDHPRPLSEAITPVGTCNDMCPEFERVERIVQKDVWTPEMDPKTLDLGYGNQVPDEARMVKKFRRSAAGLDEQLPSDLRPPAVLERTVDYLLNDVVEKAASLASVHHFIWDRTRAIRNDFSIQQVTKLADIRIAMSCYERIARFHILSLHQMAIPGRPDANYDYFQDKQQLDKTLFSLMQYYDDCREKYRSPHEPEFRAYCVLMAIQNYDPYLEDKIQCWPSYVFNSQQLKRALSLYYAAGEIVEPHGPLKPQSSLPIAQQNWERFWKIVGSSEFSYLLSCCAEMVFNHVRKTALRTIWNGFRQGKNNVQDWTLDMLMESLAFDSEDEVLDFCEHFGFAFTDTDDGQQYLNLNSVQNWQGASPGLTPHFFSHSLVERKRCGRSFSAVLRGMTLKQAQQAGLIREDIDQDMNSGAADEDSLFVPESTKTKGPSSQTNVAPSRGQIEGPAPSNLNPSAPIFGSNDTAKLKSPFAVNPPATTGGSFPPSTMPPNPFAAAKPATTSTLPPATLSNPFGGAEPFTAKVTNPFSVSQTASSGIFSSSMASSSTPFPPTPAAFNPFAPKPSEISGAAPQAVKKQEPQNKLFDSSTRPIFSSAAVGSNGPQFPPTSTAPFVFQPTNASSGSSPSSIFQTQAPTSGVKQSSSPAQPSIFASPAPFATPPLSFSANASTSLPPQSSTPSISVTPPALKEQDGSRGLLGRFELPKQQPTPEPAALSNTTPPTSIFSRPPTTSVETPAATFQPTAGLASSPSSIMPSGSVPGSLLGSSNQPEVQRASAVDSQHTAGPALKSSDPGLTQKQLPAASLFTPAAAHSAKSNVPTGPSRPLEHEVRKVPEPPKVPWKQRKAAYFTRMADELFKEAELGLLDQLVIYLTSGIAKDELRLHQQQMDRQKADRFRFSTLARRYGDRWRNIARTLRLKRQGRERRARVLAEREARAKERAERTSAGSPQDLDAFRKSIQPTERISDTGKAPENLTERQESQFRFGPAFASTGAEQALVSPLTSPAKRTSIRAQHRRSRTQPSNALVRATPEKSAYRVTKPSSAPKQSLRSQALVASMQAAAALPFSDSLFGQSVISPSTRLGTMKNSYFKLKAMGVPVDGDDDESAIMSGGQNLGKKRAFESSQEALEPAAKRRVSPISHEDIAGVPEKYRRLLEQSYRRTDVGQGRTSRSSSISNADAGTAEDEALFARLRKVREAMDESTAWFKQEREKAEEHDRSRSSSSELRRSGGSNSGLTAPLAEFQPYQPPAGNYGASHNSSAHQSGTSSPARSVPKFWGRESFFVKREDYGKSKAQREEDRKQRDAETARIAETRRKEEEKERLRKLEDEKKRLASAAAKALEKKGEDAFARKAQASNPFANSNGSSRPLSASGSNAANSSPFSNLSKPDRNSIGFGKPTVGTSPFGTPLKGAGVNTLATNGFLNGDVEDPWSDEGDQEQYWDEEEGDEEEEEEEEEREDLPSRQTLQMGGNSFEDAIEL